MPDAEIVDYTNEEVTHKPVEILEQLRVKKENEEN